MIAASGRRPPRDPPGAMTLRTSRTASTTRSRSSSARASSNALRSAMEDDGPLIFGRASLFASQLLRDEGTIALERGEGRTEEVLRGRVREPPCGRGPQHQVEQRDPADRRDAIRFPEPDHDQRRERNERTRKADEGDQQENETADEPLAFFAELDGGQLEPRVRGTE